MRSKLLYRLIGWITSIPILTLFLAEPVFTQQLNPPYPRFGIFTFSGWHEACLDIFKDFDVIAFPLNNDMARRYKEQNPNVILLATNSSFVGYAVDGPFPEAWYLHDISGNRFEILPTVWLMNMSKYCPVLDLGDGTGPHNFIQHEIRFLTNNVDFNYYDGIFHDWWWPTPGYDARQRADFNGNGIVDKDEFGGTAQVDSLWWHGMLDFHAQSYKIPNLEYIVLQVGCSQVWPYVNGACYEDFPIYNGPFEYWRERYNDTKTLTKSPRLFFLNGSHKYYDVFYPVVPYKNNYRAVRFALTSALLTSSFFYVDEGNIDKNGIIGHHGNVHFYDEFESKGLFGYPRSDMVMLTGKSKTSTPGASGVWVRFFDSGVSMVNASGMPQNVTASDLAALDPIPGSKYYRFAGGQDNVHNSGQELTDSNPVTLWGDTKMAGWLDPEVFGDGILLFRAPKVLVTPIVVDNNAVNQTSPGTDPIQYSGSWVLSSEGRKCYAVYDDRNYGVFEPSSFAWSPPGSGESVATYNPTVGLAGVYEVFEWHGYRGSNPGDYAQATNAKIKVIISGTVDSLVTVDQTTNYGKWNSLGLYSLPKGKLSRLELSNDANGIVISDAIKFVYRRASWSADSTPPNSPQNVKAQRIR